MKRFAKCVFNSDTTSSGCFRSMLYNGSEVIRDLEWVIFDEVHYINDAEVRQCSGAFLSRLRCSSFLHSRFSDPLFIPREESCGRRF